MIGIQNTCIFLLMKCVKYLQNDPKIYLLSTIDLIWRVFNSLYASDNVNIYIYRNKYSLKVVYALSAHQNSNIRPYNTYKLQFSQHKWTRQLLTYL